MTKVAILTKVKESPSQGGIWQEELSRFRNPAGSRSQEFPGAIRRAVDLGGSSGNPGPVLPAESPEHALILLWEAWVTSRPALGPGILARQKEQVLVRYRAQISTLDSPGSVHQVVVQVQHLSGWCTVQAGYTRAV